MFKYYQDKEVFRKSKEPMPPQRQRPASEARDAVSKKGLIRTALTWMLVFGVSKGFSQAAQRVAEEKVGLQFH